MTRAIVIGAGPAGLAAAACLAERRIDHVVLERGPAPLAALRRIDPEMVLLSPTRLSLPPGMRPDPGDPPYLTFAQLIGRLERFARDRGVAVTTGAEVTAVTGAPGGGFAVRWRDPAGVEREERGSHVVNATGIIGAPRLPAELVGAGLRWKHSLDVRRADLAAARRLLVIGGGPSAAEILEAWLDVRRPDDRAWLSVRRPLRAVPHRLLGVDLHYWAWLPEHLPARRLGPLVERLREPMTGTRVAAAIRRGAITQVGPVAPARIAPDLLVLATGFRYDTAHLDAVRGSPGVTLLGYRFTRTFASPYLRGIARDARHLAREIR